MRALAGSIRRVAKVSLLASVLVLAALALAQDSRPAGAVNTEIFFTVSPSSPSPPTNVILLRNEPGMPEPNELKLYVWARKIVDPYGLGGFQVDITYDSLLMSVDDIDWDKSFDVDGDGTVDDNFLETTGRGDPPLQGGIVCSDPFVEVDPTTAIGRAHVSCNTLAAPPPFGPQGDGPLATLTLKAGSQRTGAPLLPPHPTLTLTDGTFLINPGAIPKDNDGDTEPDEPPEVIPSTLRSLQITIANCADFPTATYPNGDGQVTLFGDIMGVAFRFGMTDDHPDWYLDKQPSGSPGPWVYDLNKDGYITLFGDIMGTAMQFGRWCRRP
jgi:hypothetical protein